MELPMQFNEN